MVTILAAYPWLLRTGIHVLLAMLVREAGMTSVIFFSVVCVAGIGLAVGAIKVVVLACLADAGLVRPASTRNAFSRACKRWSSKAPCELPAIDS